MPTPERQGLVIVGLSGGVDSAVAALLLRRKGYRVEGMFMKNWEEDDRAGFCSAAQDLEDAQAAADVMGIRLQRVNFAGEYWEHVFSHFLREYQAGRTPNPDVLCNKEIKFRTFLDHALALGATGIATGHYARILRTNDGWRLGQAADPEKDQTYFLYLLGQDQLRRSLMPLGDLTKAAVRRLAREAGLPNHAKKDSTGICFIGERKFRDFLQRYLPAAPGPIEDLQGHCIGEHHGLMYYTLGQRKGLRIGGQRRAEQQPWFVVNKDVRRNTLVVAQGHNHPRLFHAALEADQLHWIAGRPPGPAPYPCRARLRHRQPLQDCVIQAIGGQHCAVHFAQAQRAIAPGQSIVFYRDGECLGGGIIQRPVGAET